MFLNKKQYRRIKWCDCADDHKKRENFRKVKIISTVLVTEYILLLLIFDTKLGWGVDTMYITCGFIYI